MGHYDSYYDEEDEKAARWEKERAQAQLKLMKNFRTELRKSGTRGISPRHLDALQDTINETKLRAL